jgi:DNA polymerase-3 subunit delta'
MLPVWLNDERDRLGELIARDQLPHALLIHGPAGTGRRLLALHIVGRLLGLSFEDEAAAMAQGGLIDEETAPIHPDFSLVQPPPDKRAIPIDRIRALIAFLSLTSHQSGCKVALINPGHAMNHHAANSLLKTLEEPTAKTTILLVTDSLSRLMPTIVSRCHRIRIALPAEADALEWLGARHGDRDWPSLLELAGGAPIRALEYHQTDVSEQVAEFERDIEALQRRRATPVSVAKRWSRADPELCLGWLYARISDEVRRAPQFALPISDTGRREDDLQIGAENLNIERAFAELHHIGELRRLHGTGLNAELQLSGILTRWYGRQATGASPS